MSASTWDPPFEILASELADGIEAAKREGVERIRIRGYHESHIPQQLAFDGLAGDNSIRAVSIAEDVKVAKLDPEGLYEAQNLRELAYHSPKVRLDFRRLSRLEALHARHSPSFEELGALTELADLLVLSAPGEDCAFLSALPGLRSLRLSGGKLQSLAGVEHAARLESVGIDHLPELRDAAALGELPRLADLRVEKCRHLRDYGWLRTATSLRNLEIRGDLASLRFVEDLPHLERLVFDNLVDGDFGPLLASPSLRTVNLFPSKRHYPMRLEELQARLDERHGVG